MAISDASEQSSRASVSRVIILTDCQAALSRLQSLQHILYTKKQLQGNDFSRRIITRSQYLQRLSVQLEIRWVPGHADIKGNRYADTAARAMARSGTNCREEGIIQLFTHNKPQNERGIIRKIQSSIRSPVATQREDREKRSKYASTQGNDLKASVYSVAARARQLREERLVYTFQAKGRE